MDLEVAQATIRRHLTPTPLAESSIGLLKLETWQPTGSFKVRGAIAAMNRLSRSDHVVAASAGNHGLGVAYASRLLSIPATVVVPENASPAKVDALRAFDIELIQHGASYDEAEAHALTLGGTFVSAYNDAHVISGQASIGFELREQLGTTRFTVIVPIGGGGLAAGLTLWAARQSNVTVIGVEAAASRALSAAVEAGRILEVPIGPTIADGVAGNLEPGSITATILASHHTRIVAVSEPEIVAAMRFLAVHHGLIAEGAGCLAVAALLAGKVKPQGQAVALVTGRNITLPTFSSAVLT